MVELRVEVTRHSLHMALLVGSCASACGLNGLTFIHIIVEGNQELTVNCKRVAKMVFVMSTSSSKPSVPLTPRVSPSRRPQVFLCSLSTMSIFHGLSVPSIGIRRRARVTPRCGLHRIVYGKEDTIVL